MYKYVFLYDASFKIFSALSFSLFFKTSLFLHSYKMQYVKKYIKQYIKKYLLLKGYLTYINYLQFKILKFFILYLYFTLYY